MINITKINNREDAFIINYYTNKQMMLLINGDNIVKELNKAFEEILTHMMEQQLKAQTYQDRCLQRAILDTNYPLAYNNAIKEED